MNAIPPPPPKGLTVTVDGGTAPPPPTTPPPLSKEPAPQIGDAWSYTPASKDLLKAINDLTTKVIGTGQPLTPDIMSKVLQMLMLMAKTLQSLGLSQADQLTFCTKMQGVCTNLMSSQKVYTSADFPVVKGGTYPDASAAATALNTANQNAQTFTSRIQALRDQYGNQAKSIQSGITATDQGQQALCDFLQTFIQTMQSGMQQIFR